MRDAWFAAVVIGLGFAMVMLNASQTIFLTLQFSDHTISYEQGYDDEFEERYMEIELPRNP